jgi:hypothetical protein
MITSVLKANPTDRVAAQALALTRKIRIAQVMKQIAARHPSSSLHSL